MTRFLYFLIALLLLNGSTLAQGDGPKAYWPTPVGTNMITPMYFNIHSNQVFQNNIFVKEADFTTNIYSLMYTRVVDLKGHSAAIVGVFSCGNTEGGTPKINGEASGIADFYGIAGFNLLGAPSVTPEEYMQTKYDFVLNMLFAFKAPIGKYDADKNLNIGSNRWELKIGFPMMKFYNWGTAKVTSLEFLPSASFYTNNSNISGGDVLKQKMTFNSEAHVTQQLNKMLWISLDGFYIVGGETSIDGVNNDNMINSLQLGGTLGAYFSRKINTKISYGGVVAKNDNGMDGNMLRITASYIF